MKRRIISLIGVIALFVVGLGILLYPSFSNWWNTRRANSLIVEYEEVIAEMDTSDIELVRETAMAYNHTLMGNVLPDAFAELQLPPDNTYDNILNPTGTGYMGTVEVPKIKINLPIYHYTTEEVLEKGCGHLAGSSLPVGGDSSHCVLSAHRGLPSAKLFTDLDRVEVGDTFYLHVLEETLAYEVDQILVVEPDHTEDLSIVEGMDYCTLLTCTPYAVNSHRMLVRGHRIPFVEKQYQEDSKQIALPSGPSVLIRILCVVIGLAIALLIIFLLRRRNRRKKKKEAARQDMPAEESEVQPEEGDELPEETTAEEDTGTKDNETDQENT